MKRNNQGKFQMKNNDFFKNPFVRKIRTITTGVRGQGGNKSKDQRIQYFHRKMVFLKTIL